jgi:signal transduction histidine kinase/ligand-binding sensor domain-containing protein
LWIGTNDGLNKYDGSRFITYRHNQTDKLSLADNYVKEIFEDDERTLWVCTNTDISYYNRKKDCFVPANINLRDTLLRNIVVTGGISDTYGNIWITTRGNGLLRYNCHSNSVEKFIYTSKGQNKLHSNYLWSICSDNDHKIWVGGDSGLVNFQVVKDAPPVFHHVEFKDHIVRAVGSLFKDREGMIWAGCLEFGIYRINPRNYDLQFFNQKNSNLSSQTPYSFLHDNDGDFWVGTFSGLNLLDPSGNSFRNFYSNPLIEGSLSNSSIWSMVQDKSGLIWVGSSNGLNKYDKNIEQFRHFANNPDDRSSLKNNNVYAFCEETDTQLWIGTKNGLEKFDVSEGTFEHVAFASRQHSNIFTNDIRALIKDKAGNLWIGTWGDGIYRYHPKTGMLKHFMRDKGNPNTLPGNYVRTIYIDKAGDLWVGSTEGLSRFISSSETFITFSPEPGNNSSISGRDIFHIFEDKKNNLWVGTLHYGLNRFDRKTGKSVHFLNVETDKNSISNNAILCITQSKDGFLWIGTRNGLNQYNYSNNQFSSWNVNHGLPNDAILGIIEDKQGFLWLSTNKGLCRFDPRTQKVKNYYQKDGLQDDEFNSNAFLLSSWGDMLFGGPNGFNIFNPARLKENLFLPAIVLTDFKIFNVPVKQGEIINGDRILTHSIDETQRIDLSWKNNVFSIDFTALDYKAPEFNKYAYKLEGFDKDWIITTADRRFVTYTNLDGGKYIFKVKGSNADGLWNEDHRELVIVVHPPFWLTWWFKTLVILFILAFAFLLFRLRVKSIHRRNEMLELLVKDRTHEIQQKNEEILAQNNRLEELNATKDKFFGIIAHDLKNPFNSILGFSDLLMESLDKEDKPNIYNFANTIRLSGIHAYKLLENLLEWSGAQTGKLLFSPESFKLAELAEECIRLSEDMSKSKNISVINEVSESLMVFADRNMINTILRNLITNAIKFTNKGGSVSIRASLANNHHEITVSDTGIGIDEITKARLFKISEKVSTPGTEQEKGTGLGLLLCKEFVEKHQGKIWVESEPGKGSQFKFSIPVPQS